MFEIERMKYGMFIHLVAGQSAAPDGTVPYDPAEWESEFDVESFTSDIARYGFQYVILTAWHWRTRTLYPSKVNDKWRPGNSCSRDLLGEIIDSLAAKGVKTILYTHPRDGHDFDETDRKATGWGSGYDRHSQPVQENGPFYPVEPLCCGGETLAHPDRENYQYERWNQYISELYKELVERYGDRIIGIYTDGDGPCDTNSRHETPFQVVNYLKLRNIIKSKNPKLVLIQNAPAGYYSDDFGMPEGYFQWDEQTHDHTELWPANRKSVAFKILKSSWIAQQPESVPAEENKYMKPDQLVKYTLFAASCSQEGGVAWAAGPYINGRWENGLDETLSEAAKIIQRYEQSALRTDPSPSYPTISGDTLVSKNYCFCTTSQDRKKEFLHIMKMPENKVMKLPVPLDGACLTEPVSMTSSVSVESFSSSSDGYTLQLSGVPDEIDSVIMFSRINPESCYQTSWYNNSQRQIGLFGSWGYVNLNGHDQSALGCFDSDYAWSVIKNDHAFFWFEGDEVQIYGNNGPDGGSADVYIDLVYCGRIEQKSKHYQSRVQNFSSPGLGGGNHVLQIVVRGDGRFILDAVRVMRRADPAI